MGGLLSCLLPGMVVSGSFTSYWKVVPILTSRMRYCVWLVQYLVVIYFRVENALCTTFICTATLLVGVVVCSGCENCDNFPPIVWLVATPGCISPRSPQSCREATSWTG